MTKSYTVVQRHAPEAKEALMKAKAILAVLEARQKALTAEQRARVEGCPDLAQLDRWLRRAATLNDVRELFDQPE